MCSRLSFLYSEILSCLTKIRACTYVYTLALNTLTVNLSWPIDKLILANILMDLQMVTFQVTYLHFNREPLGGKAWKNQGVILLTKISGHFLLRLSCRQLSHWLKSWNDLTQRYKWKRTKPVLFKVTISDKWDLLSSGPMDTCAWILSLSVPICSRTMLYKFSFSLSLCPIGPCFSVSFHLNLIKSAPFKIQHQSCVLSSLLCVLERNVYKNDFMESPSPCFISCCFFNLASACTSPPLYTSS